MENENKSLKIIIASLLVIIFILLSLCAYFIFIKDNNSEKKTDNSTTNNNQVTENTKVSKVEYEIIKGLPSNINNQNLNKKTINPIKKLTYSKNNNENIKIDDNLSLLLKKDEKKTNENVIYLDVMHKNKVLNMKRNLSGEYHNYDIINYDSNTSDITIYKIDNNYLIDARSSFGQTGGSYLLLIKDDGNYSEISENMYNKYLNKVELVTDNNQKTFYLLTLKEIVEGDYEPSIYTYSIYAK